ncbi:MAG: hypothetical protein JW760_12790 [Spirochaetales bacterium]|nr:hypothetical protein [Spirochaetales bacterium]
MDQDIVKTARFKRVGARRVQKVLDALDHLSKCSDTRSYEYQDDDVKKMFNAIRAKLVETEDSFTKKAGKAVGKEFSF